jgi:hypothetical protein
MRKLKLLELALIVFFAVSVFITLTRNLPQFNDQIPSLINGMVTSISMIIGFSGAILVFTLSKQWEYLKLGSSRPIIYLVLFTLPLGLLWTVYSYLLDGNFDGAIKVAMVDLSLASVILIDYLAYYLRETMIYMRRNTAKASQPQTT